MGKCISNELTPNDYLPTFIILQSFLCNYGTGTQDKLSTAFHD